MIFFSTFLTPAIFQDFYKIYVYLVEILNSRDFTDEKFLDSCGFLS